MGSIHRLHPRLEERKQHHSLIFEQQMALRGANIQALPEDKPLVFQKEVPLCDFRVEDRMERDAREKTEEVPGRNWGPEGTGQLELIYITFWQMIASYNLNQLCDGKMPKLSRCFSPSSVMTRIGRCASNL